MINSKKSKLNIFYRILFGSVFFLIGTFFINDVTQLFWLKFALTFFVYLVSIYIVNDFKVPFFDFKKNYSQNNYKLLIVVVLGTLGLYLLSYLIPTVSNILFFNNIQNDNSFENISYVSFFAIIIIYPFLEELFFRKLIAKKIYDAKGLKPALFISAVIFSVSHIFTNYGLLGAFFGGLTLGFIYLKTFNFLFCFISHSLNNFLVIVMSEKLDYIVLNNNSGIVLFTLFLLMLLFYAILITNLNTNDKRIK